MSRIAGIVLAAGMSRRLGRPKQLLELDGVPVIRHVVRRALESSLDEVIVVVGARGEDVREALGGEPVRFVTNERYAEGQGTSLAAGVSALGPDTDAVVILLGDQPGIEPAVIDRVAAERKERGASIVVTAYGDGRGHPVLFGSEHFLELAAIDGDEGGRSVIRHNEAAVVTVVSGRDTVPPDIDTQDDWRRLQDSWPSLS